MDRTAKRALNQFLDIYGGNQCHAAQAIEYTPSRLNQMCRGERDISATCAARIHAVTNGDISMFDLNASLRRLHNANV